MEVGASGYAMAGLAWAFVATRIVHTLIHVGSNALKPRSVVYALGVLILFLMWIGVVLAVV